jgi:cytochrome c-type biogenesis protein CcmE
MNIKIVIAILLILAAVGYGAVSFVETNVQYTNFTTALSTHKKVQIKGEWLRDKASAYDASKNEFTFFMKDEDGTETKVVFEGSKPNNFELASAIVIKGRFEDQCFRASEILTKCPSKYEAGDTPVNR